MSSQEETDDTSCTITYQRGRDVLETQFCIWHKEEEEDIRFSLTPDGGANIFISSPSGKISMNITRDERKRLREFLNRPFEYGLNPWS